MRRMLATELVRGLFLGATFVFGVSLTVESQGKRHESRRKLGATHLAKDLPCLFLHRDRHTRGDLRDLQGQVIHREVLFPILCSVGCAERAFDERHHIVGDQGDAKAEQRGFGIAQRIHLTGQINRQMVKGGFSGPAISVQGGDLRSGGLCSGQVRKNMDLRFALAGGIYI